MTIFLRLKHWQLFLLLIGIPFIFQFVIMGSVIFSNNSNIMLTAFPIMMFLIVAIFFGWFYALGTNLYKKLPIDTPMNLMKFKVFLFIPVAYMVLISLFMLVAFPGFVDNGPESFASFAIIFPIHIFSMFCIFYCLYFISKAMKTVEWQRQVTFSDYAGEFFLIWFFPIGIWLIQPRINKLFETAEETLKSFNSDSPEEK
jgi:hypothetical protein